MAQPHQMLGKNVARFRYRAGLTQENFAEKADISLRYLQSIEAGRQQPRVNVLVKIQKALGISWDELFLGIS